MFISLAFLTPFFFVPLPWVSIGASKMLLGCVLVAVALLAWVVHSFVEGTLRIPRSSLVVAGALLPIAYIVSAIVTGISRESFIGMGQHDTVATMLTWYAILIVAASILGAEGGRVISVLRAFLLGGAVVLALQLVHLLVPSMTFGGALIGAAGNALGSWIDFSIFAGLLLFASIALLATPVATGAYRALAIGIATVAFFFLTISNSEHVWFALAAVAALYALFCWRHAEGEQRFPRSMWRWLALVVVALAMVWVGDLVHPRLPATLQVSYVEVRPSWTATFNIGKQAFSEPSSIFFGTGPNSFPRQWGLYKPDSVNTTLFWNTEFSTGFGFIPTSLVTVGVIGLLAWGTIIITLVAALWRAFSSTSTHSPVRSVIIFASLYLGAHHVIYVPGSALALITFFMWGLLVADQLASRSIREFAIPLSWSKWPGVGTALIVCLFAAAVLLSGLLLVRGIISQSYVNRAAIVYNNDGNVDAAARFVTRALTVEPENDRAHRAAVEIGLLRLSELLSRNEASEETKHQLRTTIESTIQHGLRAVAIGDSDYQSWLDLAQLYRQLAGAGVQGAADRAREAYLAAAQDSPKNPMPHLGLAQLELSSNDDAEARTHLEAALALKVNFAAAHYLLSQIEARAANFEKAKEHAAAAVQIAPQDPLGWYNLGVILYAAGEIENAAKAFEQAVSLKSDYSNALFMRGLAYLKLDKKDAALASFRSAAVLNPNDAPLKAIIEKIEKGEDPFATSTPAR